MPHLSIPRPARLESLPLAETYLCDSEACEEAYLLEAVRQQEQQRELESGLESLGTP